MEPLADWHQHFRRQPLLALGLAFAGGLLLASGSSRRSRRPRLGDPTRAGHVRQAWNQFESVLIGIAAARVVETVFSLLASDTAAPTVDGH